MEEGRKRDCAISAAPAGAVRHWLILLCCVSRHLEITAPYSCQATQHALSRGIDSFPFICIRWQMTAQISIVSMAARAVSKQSSRLQRSIHSTERSSRLEMSIYITKRSRGLQRSLHKLLSRVVYKGLSIKLLSRVVYKSLSIKLLSRVGYEGCQAITQKIVLLEQTGHKSVSQRKKVCNK